MVVRQQKQQQQRLLPTALALGAAAGAAVFAARSFIPSAGTAGSSLAEEHQDVSGRRQLLSGTMVASVALGAALVHEDRAAAEFLQPMDPKPTNYKKQELTPEQLQKQIQDEVGDDLGRIMNLKGQCFEADKVGKVAKVSTDTVLVWDPTSGNCPEGQAFVHAAGRGKFVPMTSSKGPAKHSYYAATLEEDFTQYKGKAGECITPPTSYQFDISWEIASKERGGKCTETY